MMICLNLKKNCKTFLFYRRKINSVFHINLNFFWDYVFPIYDYKNILPLNNKQLEEWAIMDTLMVYLQNMIHHIVLIAFKGI